VFLTTTDDETRKSRSVGRLLGESVMPNGRKILCSIALSSVLVFSGTNAANALAATTASTAAPAPPIVGATIEPQVAKVWNVWQDNFYSEATCKRASFAILYTHRYIADYRCLQNRPGSFNAGRWSLWVLVPDAV
jgi:hypothetical protein